MVINKVDKMLKECLQRYITQEVEITDCTDIIIDLGFDSITFVQFIIDIEQAYGIEFDDEMYDFQKIASYKKLYEYIILKKGSKNE